MQSPSITTLNHQSHDFSLSEDGFLVCSLCSGDWNALLQKREFVLNLQGPSRCSGSRVIDISHVDRTDDSREVMLLVSFCLLMGRLLACGLLAWINGAIPTQVHCARRETFVHSDQEGLILSEIIFYLVPITSYLVPAPTHFLS